jgi:hypothetical protein
VTFFASRFAKPKINAFLGVAKTVRVIATAILDRVLHRGASSKSNKT